MDKDISRFNIDFYNLETQEIIEHELIIQEGRHVETKNVTWNCDFGFEGKNLIVRNEYRLSGLMKKIREVSQLIQQLKKQ